MTGFSRISDLCAPVGAVVVAVAVALTLTLVVAPTVADASPQSDGAPTRAVSVHVPALLAAGLAVQYESLAWHPSVSWAAGAGVRATAAGDYRSLAFNVGGQLRYYFTGRSFRSRWRETLLGPFAGVRLDITRTTTRDRRADRDLPASLTIAEYVEVGYRFGLWGRVEITPSVGLGGRTDIDESGFLPATSRPVLTAGLTAGWLF